MKRNTLLGRIISPIVWLAAIGVLSLGLTAATFGATSNILSSSFTLGYGADSAPSGGGSTQSQVWTDNETAGANTTVTGDFGLSVAFSGRPGRSDDGVGSFTGPVFTGRVLGNGNSAAISSWSRAFNVTVNGSWTGTTPIDAAPIPNYQLSLNITSIRIYGNADLGDTGDLFFTETTPGHGSSSASASLPITGPQDSAGQYGQLTWDPADFNVAGTSSSRTFVLDFANDNPAHGRFIDGFEVFGNLVLTYDLIPEPATVTFLGLGGLLLLRRRKA